MDRLRVEADNACQDALRKLLKMEKRPFAQDDTYSKTLGRNYISLYLKYFGMVFGDQLCSKV